MSVKRLCKPIKWTPALRAVAKIIIPMNIKHFNDHIPELRCKIPELEKRLKEAGQ